MKKAIVVFALLFFTITETNSQDFNKWSIDLGTGVHLPVYPVSPGYVSKIPNFWQANAGGRYMINEKIGLRVDFGFNQFSESNTGKSFDTDYYRGTVEAVVNAGQLLDFKRWTQRINVLVHGGLGLSDIKHTLLNLPSDKVINIVFGITPQFKLTDRVALFLDVSTVLHSYQDTSFDGYSTTSIKGFNGQILNGSIGLNIYLGKNKVHADWYTKSDDIEEKEINESESLKKRLKVTETKIDELSSIKNDYDALVSELDNRYSKKGDSISTVSTKVDFIKDLLNKGYQNVYFDFGESSIQKHSLEAINYLYKYMSENPSAKVEITGYADELGSTIGNEILSIERAKKVYDVLVAFGISSNRLSYNGKGEDTSVNKRSGEARQLVRRVTFTIK